MRSVDVAAADHPFAEAWVPSEQVGGPGSGVDEKERGEDGHYKASGSSSWVICDLGESSIEGVVEVVEVVEVPACGGCLVCLSSLLPVEVVELADWTSTTSTGALLGG